MPLAEAFKALCPGRARGVLKAVPERIAARYPDGVSQSEAATFAVELDDYYVNDMATCAVARGCTGPVSDSCTECLYTACRRHLARLDLHDGMCWCCAQYTGDPCEVCDRGLITEEESVICDACKSLGWGPSGGCAAAPAASGGVQGSS